MRRGQKMISAPLPDNVSRCVSRLMSPKGRNGKLKFFTILYSLIIRGWRFNYKVFVIRKPLIKKLSGGIKRPSDSIDGHRYFVNNLKLEFKMGVIPLTVLVSVAFWVALVTFERNSEGNGTPSLVSTLIAMGLIAIIAIDRTCFQLYQGYLIGCGDATFDFTDSAIKSLAIFGAGCALIGGYLRFSKWVEVDAKAREKKGAQEDGE